MGKETNTHISFACIFKIWKVKTKTDKITYKQMEEQPMMQGNDVYSLASCVEKFKKQ